MVWINRRPQGEEQLFYEYISATSYEAGANEWASKAQGLIKEMEWLIEHAKECESKYGISGDAVIEAAGKALAKYKEVSNG